MALRPALRAVAAIAIALCAAHSSGCASSPRKEPAAISPQLVMPVDPASEPAASVDESARFVGEHLQMTRNDHRLGGLPGDDLVAAEYIEVRHYDRQRTVNGRPWEYSYSFTRSVKRGFAR